MTDRTFRSALEEMLGSIERPIEKVAAGEGSEPELHTVRTYLLDVLELVERFDIDRLRLQRAPPPHHSGCVMGAAVNRGEARCG